MPVSRAYVGLSAPVGYDYARPAEKAESDLSSSPNPILVGVTGLLVLFDEIWFACPSVCPQSMRGLDYVKFLGAERPDIALDEAQVEAVLDAEARAGGRSVGLNDIHPGGYGAFMSAYYGMTSSDNHTHAIDCFGGVVNGNPDSRNLERDLLVLDRLEGDFFCVMNGLTRCMTFPDGLEWIRNTPEQEAVRLADRALSIASIYDLTGPEGPYHPVLEELRNHPFIAAFRTWARGTTLALHNRLVEEVAEELDAVTGEFARTALRKAVGSGGLKEASLDFIEGVAMDLLPGGVDGQNCPGHGYPRHGAAKPPGQQLRRRMPGRALGGAPAHVAASLLSLGGGLAGLRAVVGPGSNAGRMPCEGAVRRRRTGALPRTPEFFGQDEGGGAGCRPAPCQPCSAFTPTSPSACARIARAAA